MKASMPVCSNYWLLATDFWLLPLRHSHQRSAFGWALPSDFVHEGAHEEDTTPGSFQDVLTGGRVCKVRVVEALAAVAHCDDEPRVRARHTHLDRLRLVRAVAMQNGVRHGLAHGKLDAKQRVVGEAQTARGVGGGCRRLADGLDAARQFEFDGLFGHFAQRRRPAPTAGRGSEKSTRWKAYRKPARCNTPAARLSRKGERPQGDGRKCGHARGVIFYI